MKQIYLIPILLFLLTPPLAFASSDIWSDTHYAMFSDASFTYSTGSNPAHFFSWFRPDGSNTGYVGYATSANTAWPTEGEVDGVDPYGIWTVVEFVPGSLACQSGTLSACEADLGFDRENAICVGDLVADCSMGGGGGGSDFGALIAANEDNFNNSTGLSFSGLMGFMENDLFPVIAGSGLAVIYYMRFWLAALFVIASIIFFTKRGYQFFRH